MGTVHGVSNRPRSRRHRATTAARGRYIRCVVFESEPQQQQLQDYADFLTSWGRQGFSLEDQHDLTPRHVSEWCHHDITSFSTWTSTVEWFGMTVSDHVLHVLVPTEHLGQRNPTHPNPSRYVRKFLCKVWLLACVAIVKLSSGLVVAMADTDICPPLCHTCLCTWFRWIPRNTISDTYSI